MVSPNKNVVEKMRIIVKVISEKTKTVIKIITMKLKIVDEISKYFTRLFLFIIHSPNIKIDNLLYKYIYIYKNIFALKI